MVFPLDLGPAPYHWPSNQLQAVSKGKLCPEPFSGFLQASSTKNKSPLSTGHWHPINLLLDTGYWILHLPSRAFGHHVISTPLGPWGCGCWHSPPTWTAISDSPRWAETPRLRSGPPDDAPGIHCRHLGSWSKIPSHPLGNPLEMGLSIGRSTIHGEMSIAMFDYRRGKSLKTKNL